MSVLNGADPAMGGMRTSEQQSLVDRLRGYAAEVQAKAPIKRRRAIAGELINPEAVLTFDLLRRSTPTRRDFLRRSFLAFAENREAQWPIEEERMTLPGWPIEGGKEAHPVTRTSQEHVDFGESPAVDFALPGTGIGDWTVAQFPGSVTIATYVGGEYGPGHIIEYEGEVEGVGYVKVGLCHHGTNLDGGLLVVTGDAVEPEQRLGPVGYSGWCIPAGPDGTHVHMKVFVMQDNGVWLRVDPETVLG